MNFHNNPVPRESSEDAVHRAVLLLQSLIGKEDRICLVYGAGGQPASFYPRCDLMSDVVVRWAGSTFPWYMRFLSFLPSHAGLIEISKGKALIAILDLLSDSTLVEIYWLERSYADQLALLISARGSCERRRSLAMSDSRSILYSFDMNNPASSTGVYEWIFFGSEISAEIREGFI